MLSVVVFLLYQLSLLISGTGALPLRISISIKSQRTIQSSAESENNTPGSAASLLHQQLQNPSGVLSVLLLIGGDIVQKACAQLSSGNRGRKRFIPTPVAFSFGWVGYAFGALMSAFADGSLMPAPDISCSVVTVGGQWKKNESWVLGRLTRDLELANPRSVGGLRIVFYKTAGDSNRPHHDKIRWTTLCIPLQFGISTIPWFLHGNGTIMLVTGFGTVLAIITGSLRQWKKEKYSGRMSKGSGKRRKKRKDKQQTYILTRGNGHGHAFVIRLCKEHDFINLDDFASARVIGGHSIRSILVGLSILWIFLLIIVGGIKQDTWYLLLVGLMGMFQNVIVAGFRRQPKAHGLPIIEDPAINTLVDKTEVLAALKEADRQSKGVGRALVPLFFPAGLKDYQWPAEEDLCEKMVTKNVDIVSTDHHTSLLHQERAANKSSVSSSFQMNSLTSTVYPTANGSQESQSFTDAYENQ